MASIRKTETKNGTKYTVLYDYKSNGERKELPINNLTIMRHL
jgi:hypothetical protein